MNVLKHAIILLKRASNALTHASYLGEQNNLTMHTKFLTLRQSM